MQINTCVTFGGGVCTDEWYWSVDGGIIGASTYISPAITSGTNPTFFYVSSTCDTPKGTYVLPVTVENSDPSVSPYFDTVQVTVTNGICSPPTPTPSPTPPAAQRIVQVVNQIIDTPNSGICATQCALEVNTIVTKALGHDLSDNGNQRWVPRIRIGISAKGYGHLLTASTTAAGAIQAVAGDIAIENGYDTDPNDINGEAHVGICMNNGCTVVASNWQTPTSDGTCHLSASDNSFTQLSPTYTTSKVTAFYHISN